MATKKLIINIKTRVIHCITVLETPEYDSEKQLLIDVPDDYELSGPDKKLDVDNITQLDATEQDISDMKDDYDVSRIELRDFRDKATKLKNASPSPDVKNLMDSLLNYFKMPE